MNELQEKINQEMRKEIQRHARVRQKQFQAYRIAGDIWAIYAAYVVPVIKETWQRTLSPDGKGFLSSLRLGKHHSLKTLEPFFTALIEAGWELPEPPARDTSSIDYVWKHPSGFTWQVWVYPHEMSENCVRVKVGVQDVYEWRCKDPE